MTDEEADFIRTIVYKPGDNAPRLVYADWLDDHAGTIGCDWCRGSGEDRPPTPVTTPQGTFVYKGPLGPCPKCKGVRVLSDGNAERAEFIRVQCELARLSCRHGCTPRCNDDDCRACALRRRERELLYQNWSACIRQAGMVPDGWALSTDGDTFHVWRDEPFDNGFRLLFRRGFVAEVRLPTAAFVGGPCGRCDGGGRRIGADRPFEWNVPNDLTCPDCKGEGRTPGLAMSLFKEHPITAVRLTDREPGQFGNTKRWYWTAWTADTTYDRHTLPIEILRLTNGRDIDTDRRWSDRLTLDWPTRDAALAALSAACVKYGRGKSGAKLWEEKPGLDRTERLE